MKAIDLLPLGGASPELVESLREPLRRTFRVGVEARAWDVDLEQFLDAARGQYNSTDLLVHLKTSYGPLARDPGLRSLALVPCDLFIPILTYVFGEAEVGGNVAVVSYYRLAPERYGLPPDAALLAGRFVKEVIHEIGHVCSLIHCSDLSCVMHASSYVEEIDLKKDFFCHSCASELSRRF